MAQNYVNVEMLKRSLKKVVGTSASESSELSLNGLNKLIYEKTNGIATSDNLESLQTEVHGTDGNGGLKAQVAALEAKHAEGKTVAKEVADGVANKVDKVEGSRLMTDAEGTKLAGVEKGAQVNVIESVAEGTDSPYLEVSTAGKAVTVTFSLGENDDKLVTASEMATAASDAVANKVDKDGNKVLSTNDFTNDLKTALETVSGTGAGSVKEAKDAADAAKTEAEAKVASVALADGVSYVSVDNTDPKNPKVGFSRGTGADKLVTSKELAEASDTTELAGKVSAIEADYLKTADKTELSNAINTEKGRIDKLVGDDADKSVRTIANEELAKQLIPDGAKESLDTLQEIAAWIQAHPGEAAEMNQKISALETKVGDSSVADQVKAAVEALNVEDAAVAGQYVSAVSEADGKIAVSHAALPTELKNPNALTIGSGTDTIVYDGSEALTFAPATEDEIDVMLAELFPTNE